MHKFVNTAVKVIAGIMIVALVGYAGACVYGNWIAKPKDTVTFPVVEKAPYMLTVKNTGTIILSPDVKQVGPDIPGQRIYLLPDGYWEITKGMKFKYIQFKDFRMDEEIWGKIELTRRS
jgi:hypothetical protein